MTRADRSDLTATIVTNIRALRQVKGIAGREVVAAFAADGIPMSLPTLSNLERGYKRASITVDELFAFARVLDVEPMELTRPGIVCENCRNRPPDGFACRICGRAR